jgi:hypothetical protein
MRIMIGAVISLSPYSPGIAWDWLQYAVGFRRLGHEVYYIEEVKPEWCVDSHGERYDFEHSINRDLFRASMERVGLMGKACQIYNHGEATFGLSFDSLVALSKDADLIINMAGHVKTEPVMSNIKRRIYVDQDPVYTQLWHAEYGKDLGFKMYDGFFSVGLNIGTPHTAIPDCGVRWHHVLPPVVLEYWPFQIDPSCRRFTTIASWAGFSDLCYRGEWYRSKCDEFTRFAELPRKVAQELEVSMKYHHGDEAGIRLLKDNGWGLTEASHITDLSSYQRYIVQSRAEIGIAKNAYVKGCSGWFSDRSAHYLTSGKPVLAQSTGFERVVPTGRGLLSFRNMEEAVAGVEAINRDYKAHCRAAREFAEEYLDYRKVLPEMLELCMA